MKGAATARHRQRDVRLRILGLRARRVLWRTAGQHYLTLASAVVLASLAILALTSDAFRASDAAPAASAPEYRLSWAPAGAVNPEVAVTYVDAMIGLSPLERARQRPRGSRGDSGQTLIITLPQASEQERAEALLTALADAIALGLTLQVIDN